MPANPQVTGEMVEKAAIAVRRARNGSITGLAVREAASMRKDYRAMISAASPSVSQEG
jgi:hypothetical protein